MTAMVHRAHLTDAQVGTFRGADAILLAVGGELDARTASRFVLAGLQALAGRERTTLAVDMGRVSFISAAGIGALIAIRNHAALDGNVVVVTEPSRCVLRLLELAALTGAFGVRVPNGRADRTG
jgi:anti-anti-sigma factor